MPYIYREFPELSWSTSRIKSLENCKRGYFYHYYLSHNGWDNNANQLQKDAFLLKKLSSKDLLCGSIVHKALKYLITKNNKGIEINKQLIDYITKRAISNFRQCCDVSEQYGGSWSRQIKDFDMLQEYFYYTNLTPYDKYNIESKITRGIENGAGSNTFKYLQSNKVKILELDLDKFTHFYLNGIKIYSKLDLLYIDEDGKYIIVEWKTGREDSDNELQLAVYTTYVSKKYNINPSNIICRIEYVDSNTVIEKVFSDQEINDVELIIDLSMNAMLGYLEDEMINKAKCITEFNMTKDTYKCKNCNFRKLCY